MIAGADGAVVSTMAWVEVPDVVELPTLSAATTWYVAHVAVGTVSLNVAPGLVAIVENAVIEPHVPGVI